MIDEISIARIATFDTQPEKLNALSKFNYLFGSNGTGKTTISRVIANEDGFPTCKVTWRGGTVLQPMVYNRDFVERNFNQSAELKGVFTLGEKQVDIHAKIDAAKKELDALTVKIEGLNQTLQGADGAGGKRAELVELDNALKENCWAQKQKHDEKLQGAFEGYRGSSEKFKGKVIHELTSNSAALLTLAELEKKAESVFGKAPTTEQSIIIIDTTKLLSHESNPILKKRVIGKEDVDIAGMIKKLRNSDWVRQGRRFYDVNEGFCPFCQQSTDEKFTQSLNDYFDETFETDSKAIDVLATNYETDAARLQQQVTSIIEAPSRFLDVEKMKAEKELLDSKITINKQRLAGKKKEASRVVELESVPIKTSYELLWSEVRNPDRSNLAIQNTLRRILENYFKILGGVDADEITGMFEGKEKLICKSLFSWVNDGSHYAHDDLYVSIDNSTVENYLNVFRAIFDKAGHFAHYEMMMGDVLVGSVNE